MAFKPIYVPASTINLQIPTHFKVKEDKSLSASTKIAVIVIPNESSFGAVEDSQVFSSKNVSDKTPDKKSFKELSEIEKIRPIQEQKVLSIELCQSQDPTVDYGTSGKPNHSSYKAICKFLIKLGNNAYCNAKYEVNSKITNCLLTSRKLFFLMICL